MYNKNCTTPETMNKTKRYDISYTNSIEKLEDNGRKELVDALNTRNVDLLVRLLDKYKTLQDSFLINYIKDENCYITPLEAIIESDQPEMLNVILDRDITLNNGPFLSAYVIKYNSKNSMEYLIKNKDIDVNQEYIYDTSKTLLNVAVEKNEQDIIKLLVENGADMFKKSRNGDTPFYLACNNYNKDVVDYFFDFMERKIKNEELLLDVFINNANETINKIENKKPIYLKTQLLIDKVCKNEIDNKKLQKKITCRI